MSNREQMLADMRNDAAPPSREQMLADMQAAPQQAAPQQAAPRQVPQWPDRVEPERNKMSDFSGYTKPSEGKEWARMIPEVGGAMMTGGALNVISKIPRLIKAAPTLAKYLGYTGGALTSPKSVPQAGLGGAIEGAGSEALKEGSDGRDIAGGAALGAAFGGAGQKIFGPGMKGMKVDERAQRLMDRGVDVVTGGRAGRGARAVEDKMMSFPMVGGAIDNARIREKESFNRAVINDAMSAMDGGSGGGKDMVPYGVIAGKPRLPDNIEMGGPAIKYADDYISKGYKNTLDNIVVKGDPEFAADMNNIRSMATELPDLARRRAEKFINRNITEQMDNPTDLLMGQTFQKSYSDLGKEARALEGSLDPWMKDAGLAISESRKALERLNMRQNPAAGEKLKGLNTAFARMRTVENAATKSGAHDRIFNASQFSNAVKQAGDSRTFSHGEAFGQEMAEDAVAVMSQKVNNSGTTDRAIMTGLLAGGGTLAGSHIPALAGVAAGAAAYSRPGQKYLNDMLFRSTTGAGRIPMREGVSALPGLISANIGAGVDDKEQQY